MHSFCADNERGWWRSGYVSMITDSSLEEKSLSFKLSWRLSSEEEDEEEEE